MNLPYVPHGRHGAAVVRVWGPVPRHPGATKFVWPVAVLKPDGRPASQVYPLRSFDSAMTLARRMSDDRRLPLECDATRSVPGY